jgi:hypothetical protein
MWTQLLPFLDWHIAETAFPPGDGAAGVFHLQHPNIGLCLTEKS